MFLEIPYFITFMHWKQIGVEIFFTQKMPQISRQKWQTKHLIKYEMYLFI